MQRTADITIPLSATTVNLRALIIHHAVVKSPFLYFWVLISGRRSSIWNYDQGILGLLQAQNVAEVYLPGSFQ